MKKKKRPTNLVGFLLVNIYMYAYAQILRLFIGFCVRKFPNAISYKIEFKP